MRHALTRRLTALIVALSLLASLAAATPVLAAAIVVNSLADTTADDGVCTLREAIAAANTDTASGASPGECAAGSGTDTIALSAAGTIILGSVLPTITSELSIAGAGAITVSGASTFRVFEVTPLGTVTLSGITITGGFSVADGGGIRNAGTLTVTNSTLSGNSAGSEGGAIDNLAILTVTNSTISGNSAINAGGILSSGILTVTNSTISGNTASNNGGGMTNVGTATVTNSTLSGNSAGLRGGGIRSPFGTLTVTNSTLSGNSAGTNSGGIDALSTETIVNSIVAGNTAPADPDVGSVVETDSTNVIGVPGGMTVADILDVDGLADNGGPTQTIALALVAGNPAIDEGDGPTCAMAPVGGLDQRGLPRPAACDIGAYEAQPPTVAAHANVTAPATSAAGAAVSYTAPAGTVEQDGNAAVACLPASGATFPVGSTTVTCTATDAVGHTGTGSFAVIVGAFTPPATPTPTPTPSTTTTPTTTPTASAALLPNTAAGAGAAGAAGLTIAIAALSLLSLALLVRATSEGRRR